MSDIWQIDSTSTSCRSVSSDTHANSWQPELWYHLLARKSLWDELACMNNPECCTGNLLFIILYFTIPMPPLTANDKHNGQNCYLPCHPSSYLVSTPAAGCHWAQGITSLLDFLMSQKDKIKGLCKVIPEWAVDPLDINMHKEQLLEIMRFWAQTRARANLPLNAALFTLALAQAEVIKMVRTSHQIRRATQSS